MQNVEKVNADKAVAVIVASGMWWERWLGEALLKKGLGLVVVGQTGTKKGWENLEREGEMDWVEWKTTLFPKMGRFEYMFFGLGGGQEIGLDLPTLSTNLKECLVEAGRQRAKFMLVSDLTVFEGEVMVEKMMEVPKGRLSAMNKGEAMRLAESLVVTEVRDGQINGRIVRLGSVYGPGMPGSDLPMGYLINRVWGGEEIKGEQLWEKLYPVWVEEVVSGMERAMFGGGTNGLVVALASETPVTVEKVVDLLEKEVGRKAVLRGSPRKGVEISSDVLVVGWKSIGWRPVVGLAEGLRRWSEGRVKASDAVDKKEKEVSSAIPMLRRSEVRQKGGDLFKFKGRLAEKSVPSRQDDGEMKVDKKGGGWRLGLSLCLVGLVLFLWVWPAMALVVGGACLYNAWKNLGSDVSMSGEWAERSRFWFREAERGGSRTVGWPVVGRIGEWYGEWAVLGEKSADGVVSFGKVWLVLATGSEEKLVGVKEEVENIKGVMAYWLTEGETALPWPLNYWWQKEEGKVELTRAIKFLSWVKEGLPYWPELVGYEGRRSYLVLLQNNLELRPTGGFIGSLAIITLEKGKIVDFQVMDSGFADGLLAGHVEPPATVRKYLGETAWYLRDSNWDPNYPTSAARAEWFLEKELGRKVDGVVAVNLDFLRRCLSVVGPVHLMDSREEITADNLLERVEYGDGVGGRAFGGQEKDLMAQVASLLKEEVSRRSEGRTLVWEVGKALESKELMVFLKNKEMAQLVDGWGWDGKLGAVRCEAGVVCDRVLIVNANVGVNRANYFVKQKANYWVDLTEEEKVKGKMDLVYENTASSESWPAGRLKDYVRVYLPENTVLEKIEVVNEKTGESVLYKEKQIEKEEMSGWKVWGFLIEVPIGEARKVELAYSFPRAREATVYRLSWLKQSGDRWGEVGVRLKHPPQWRPLVTDPVALTMGSELLYNVDLMSDRVLGAQFAKVGN